MTIAEFQNNLENTQRLLAETSVLSESERNDLQSHITQLDTMAKSLKDSGDNIGIFDSLYYNIGWGWENTALHKTKDNALILERHIMPMLKTLQQKMTTNATKYSEMNESVKFLSQNFQGLIDSNRVLIHKVDGLETQVAELRADNQELKAQNQEIKAQNQEIKTQNQEIMQMLRGIQNRSSFVTTQASSFVSYTSNPSSTSFITSLD
jgi:septal ring factor EnvC (AmiA/AmiB activator)